VTGGYLRPSGVRKFKFLCGYGYRFPQPCAGKVFGAATATDFRSRAQEKFLVRTATDFRSRAQEKFLMRT